MGSLSIQNKIKAGLAKAVSKTGSASSDKIYLVSKTIIGGENPLNTATAVETDILLTNAIFKSFDKSQFSGDVLAGDRMLVSNSDVLVSVGDTIKEGATRYIVVNQDVKSPTSDTLVYISQLRAQ